MHNQSKREIDALIELLKKDESIRVKKDFNYNQNMEHPEEYWLLAEHLVYLMEKKKKVDSEIEKQNISMQIHKVNQYMEWAKYGDRNIGRFNEP